MRRQWLLNVAAVASLLLCAAFALLWSRSYERWDRFVSRRPAHGVGLQSSEGHVVVNVRRTDVANDFPPSGWSLAPWPDHHGNAYSDPLPIDLGFSGFPPRDGSFMWETAWGAPEGTWSMSRPAGPRPTVGDRYLRVVFPHWVLVVACAALPAARGFGVARGAWRRRRRRRSGACPDCGYDLRATPGRCLECGTRPMPARRDA
jgi:hypothetical protein